MKETAAKRNLVSENKMTLIGVHPVKQNDLGFNGNLFGGKLMYWIDGDCAAYAMEVCDNPRMVTVSIDKCIFRRKATQSHLIKVYAEVLKFGHSSVTLGVEARRHNVYNGSQEIILSTEIKFVRVDEDGYPLPITCRRKQKLEVAERNDQKKEIDNEPIRG